MSARFELNNALSTPVSEMRPQPAQPFGGLEGQEVGWKQEEEQKSSLHLSWLLTLGLLRW